MMSTRRKATALIPLTPEMKLSVITYRNRPVMTLAMIDKVHQRPKGTARKRFNDHKDRLVGGEDYYRVCAAEIRTHKILRLSSKAHEDIILLTEMGYSMLVKSFQDELAWKIQKQLVTTYFRAARGDVTLADEIAERASPHQQKWLLKRMQGKVARSELTSTLARHGVSGRGYADCTNAIYKNLLGGSKKDICAARGIDYQKSRSLRDQMNIEDLISTSMAEMVAAKQIRKFDVQGNAPCEMECDRSARRVAALLQ